MTKRLFGIISLASVIALALSSCSPSTSPETALGEIPSSDTSASTSESPDPLKKHAEFLAQSEDSFQILNETHSVGSTTLRLGDLPGGFDSVGFIISCDATSPWEIILLGGSKTGASGCDSNSEIYTSLSTPAHQINTNEVQLEFKEPVGVWVTVYATNED